MRNFGSICRWVSLSCCGLSLFVADHFYPVNAKAFNDVCGGYGEEPSVTVLGLLFAILAAPQLLARSRPLIVLNLVVGLITIAYVIALPYTIRYTLGDCDTANGIFELSTKGLDGFSMWLCVVALLSYVLVMVDLTIWGTKKLIASGRTFRRTDAI